MGELDRMDMELLIYIHNRTHSHAMDRVMPMITKLGNMGQMWIIISLALLFNNKYRSVGVAALFALLLSKIIGEDMLKPSIKRQRPFEIMPYVQLLTPRPSSYSFPSGHAASSFAAAGVIASAIPALSMPVIILAGLIAFSRVYLFVHYPSDIIGGMLLGLICAGIALSFCKNIGV